MSLPLIAEISKSKLLYNIKAVKRLTKKSKICAVVKSDAYGHGLVEIANALYNEVDCYAVSLESECVALRYAGIDKNIILLTPAVSENFENLISLGITLSVSSLNEIKLAYRVAKRLNKKAKIHIAVNTGMNRLGFDSVCDVKKAIKYLKGKDNIVCVTGVFSHLGNVENLNYSKIQRAKFLKFSAVIKKAYPNAISHLSSSGGILLGNEFLFDMVRVGIMLYGYAPFNTNKIKLKPILKVKARVVLKRKSVKSKRVGYGDKRVSADNLAVVRLGYADGIRRVGTIGIINNACMDLCMINKRIGRLYTVFNDITKLSNEYKTITYETLVNITKRAERIYK